MNRLALAPTFGLLACGMAPSGEPPDLLAGADLALLADLGTPYPAGPYGNKVGDVLEPLAWEGYDNPTAMGLASDRPYGPLSMDDLRRSGRRFALIYAADEF